MLDFAATIDSDLPSHDVDRGKCPTDPPAPTQNEQRMPIASSDPVWTAFRHGRAKDIYKQALKILKDSTSEHPMNTGELIGEIESKLNVQRSYPVLLQLSKTDGSEIRSKRGAGGGYFLDQTGFDESSEGAAVDEEAAKEQKALERHIWPLVVYWFVEEKGSTNCSSDIANLKRGGIWSNPDVVSLAICDELGFKDLEVTTAEVKPSQSNWRYFFFEAVSHRRFADKSYFIFRTDASGPSDLEEMKAYAARFGVGLVSIEMDDELYHQLPDWRKLDDQVKLTMLNSFNEIVPPAYEAVPVREKIEFLRRLGIQTIAALHQFGNKRR